MAKRMGIVEVQSIVMANVAFLIQTSMEILQERMIIKLDLMVVLFIPMEIYSFTILFFQTMKQLLKMVVQFTVKETYMVIP